MDKVGIVQSEERNLTFSLVGTVVPGENPLQEMVEVDFDIVLLT